LIGVPSAYYPIKGLPQIHKPLVHGFIVLPTPKPVYLFNSILFIKYDFPVLYIPTTDITAIGPGIDFTKSMALSLTLSSLKLLEKLRNLLYLSLYCHNKLVGLIHQCSVLPFYIYI